MLQNSKIKVFVSVFVVIVAVVYVFYFQYSIHQNKIVPIDLNGHKLHVELVSSKDKLEKGLGGRADMCSNCGMLFEFQLPGKYSFWMKGMQFPLDLIWIYQKKIVHIEKNIPASYDGMLVPAQDADMVLEINAGILDQFQVKIGDMIAI